MSDVKLVLSDLDGTLLNNNSVISNYTSETIRLLVDKGIKFVPVSGRGLSILLVAVDKILQNVDYLVSSNGAAIYNAKDLSVVKCISLDKKDVINIYECAQKYNLELFCIIDGYYFNKEGIASKLVGKFVKFDNKWKVIEQSVIENGLIETLLKKENNVHKITIMFPLQQIRQQVFLELSALKTLHISSAKKNNLEISSIQADKGTALDELCYLYNISPSNTMAIGDASNDIPMITKAKTGVLLKNYIGDIQEYSNLISDYDNNDDGAAKMIRKICL